MNSSCFCKAEEAENSSVQNIYKTRKGRRKRGNDVVMVMKERDEELALFLEMRRREKEKSNLLLPLNSSDEQNNHLGTVPFFFPSSFGFSGSSCAW